MINISRLKAFQWIKKEDLGILNNYKQTAFWWLCDLSHVFQGIQAFVNPQWETVSHCVVRGYTIFFPQADSSSLPTDSNKFPKKYSVPKVL